MKEFLITVNGKTYEVQVEEKGETPSVKPIPTPKAAPEIEPIPNPASPKPEVKPLSASSVTLGKIAIKSPMPGTILEIKVKSGDTVKSGAVLCILEAMKMENEIMSPQDGVIASVNTSKGASVNTGDLLLTID